MWELDDGPVGDTTAVRDNPITEPSRVGSGWDGYGGRCHHQRATRAASGHGQGTVGYSATVRNIAFKSRSLNILPAAGWTRTLANPPAITTAQATAERIASTRRMVDDALTSTSKERAQSMREGMVGDYHFLETVEPIKQLKREGRYEEALTLCYGAIAAAERAAEGRSPALFYTEQAAIIHRKLGQRDKEAAVLQRWLRACPPDKRAGSDIQARLDKLLAKPDRTKALDS